MPHKIHLPEKLDTAASARLLAEVRAASGSPLSLDAAKTRSVGAICAKILLSTQEKWKVDGFKFQIQAAAEIINDLRLLGLGDLNHDKDIHL